MMFLFQVFIINWILFMAKISDFDALVATPADDDLFHVADEDNKSYKMSWDDIKTYAQQYKGLTVTSFNLSAGDIETLGSTPVELFTGISSDERVILICAVLYYNYGTSAYTNRLLGIYSGNLLLTNLSQFENGGNDSYVVFGPVQTSSGIGTDDIVLKSSNGNPGGVGDGVMELQTLTQTISI